MIKIPTLYKSIEFIRPISWEEIFKNWEKNEAPQESWKKHWTEIGCKSWKEWRSAFATPLKPEQQDWFLCEIKNPLEDSLNFYGVPSRAWIEKCYNGEKTKQIKDVLFSPVISENQKILAIKNNFPKKTILIGIVFKNKIIIYEGQHRTCALAIWDKKIPFKEKVFIALAKWKGEEFPAVGGKTRKISSKN